jgi:hypothetical protein
MSMMTNPKPFFALAALMSVLFMASCKTQEDAVQEMKATYTADVKPIIDAGCGTKCHSATKHAGGIDLTTYASVMKEATEGKLLAAVRHEDGVEAMPRNAPKLDAEAIAILEAWVHHGAPE